MARRRHRREGFSEGWSFIDCRGRRWYLPVLGADARDRFPSIRRFSALSAALRRDDAARDPDRAAEVRLALLAVLLDLVGTNYSTARLGLLADLAGPASIDCVTATLEDAGEVAYSEGG
jgi:hypothetical protein